VTGSITSNTVYMDTLAALIVVGLDGCMPMLRFSWPNVTCCQSRKPSPYLNAQGTDMFGRN